MHTFANMIDAPDINNNNLRQINAIAMSSCSNSTFGDD